ncbi:secreted RxLR effector protein 161-like [Osmia bicornis bicornis]|uniref:secreted RxLR effector protein 161-like n=1 Tax=Osmia bicornis bicornis TaxID=1437191 RepID=UPI001EAEACAE|nr:secreted RxLR effector protein 161-like [Osmia bicornis bicornis]
MPENTKYQQLIGALLYLTVNTRPDIAESVGILSQHNKQPTTADWTEAKRVARYLKGTMSHELKLGQRNAKKELIGFADADWAQDTIDRKSHSGYLFQFCGASLSWGCRKQTNVTLSSTEAEYVALAEATQEGLWIHRLLKDFAEETQEKIIIYEDNQSCLNLVYNNKFSNRTKHIDTKFHFMKDLKEQGIVDYRYCPTDQMPADMLTKPLGRVKLKYMSEKCGLTG